MNNIALLRRIIQLAAPFRRSFIVALVLALFLAVLNPLRPYLVQQTVDNYIFVGDMAGLQKMIFLLLGVLCVESICRYNFMYLTDWLGASVIKNLRVKVFEHILNFRLRYFDITPIGTSTTRAINDVETINDIFSEGLINIFADLLMLLMVIALMFYTNWKIALVCLALFPLILINTYIFKENTRKASVIVRNQVARLNAFLQEHISGMGIVQTFSAEKNTHHKFSQINREHADAQIKTIWSYSVFFPIMEIILASALGLMVWYGSKLVIDHETTLGTLIAFILYINMLFNPLRTIADKANTLQMGMIAADRVFGILDLDERIPNNGTISAQHTRGEVTFEQVWFSYNETDWVLRGISFQLPAGKSLAIVGATGAGKSSIINLINRFYDIQKGAILLDGTPINQYELHSLRQQVGLVLQDVFLFSGSIYDNITLRSSKVTHQEVENAARFVGAHEFIERLPNGYNYQVMERGATLSMGQRQLISFIRALVFNPQILILDEATSSIDTETEEMVQAAMGRLMSSRTSIIIAHRLSTVQNADTIMVMHQGNIVEMGTHQSLLQAEGYYKNLYDKQFATTTNR